MFDKVKVGLQILFPFLKTCFSRSCFHFFKLSSTNLVSFFVNISSANLVSIFLNSLPQQHNLLELGNYTKSLLHISTKLNSGLILQLKDLASVNLLKTVKLLSHFFPFNLVSSFDLIFNPLVVVYT